MIWALRLVIVDNGLINIARDIYYSEEMQPLVAETLLALKLTC